MSKYVPRWYWVGFGICQLAGSLLPAFVNGHNNIAPLAGALLSSYCPCRT